VEAQPRDDAAETIESLRRRLEAAERLVRLFDAQVHVLERERQKLAAVVGHGDVGFLVVDASLHIVWTNEYFAKHLKASTDPSSLMGAIARSAAGRSPARAVPSLPRSTPKPPRIVSSISTSMERSASCT
jgi:hypothetical protein